METHLIKSNGNTQALIHHQDYEQICKDYLFSVDTKLTPQQQMLFLNLAKESKLNPFKREIYAIKYGNNFNVVTGYQVYIKKAQATGQLNGWIAIPTHNEDGSLKGAKITIYRKDFDYPFEWEVSLKEFKKPQANWSSMPEFMIKKVAICQGFRLAFPDELGGLPYTPEELASGDVEEIKPKQTYKEVAKETKQYTEQPTETVSSEVVEDEDPLLQELYHGFIKRLDALKTQQEFKELSGAIIKESEDQLPQNYYGQLRAYATSKWNELKGKK